MVLLNTGSSEMMGAPMITAAAIPRRILFPRWEDRKFLPASARSEADSKMSSASDPFVCPRFRIRIGPSLPRAEPP